MQSLRVAIAERLQNPAPYHHDRFAGRGIVTCAGGRRYFTCAWVLIWILRRVHRSKLPIQLWHLGRGEMSEAMRLLLEAEEVEVVNAESVLHQYPAKVGGGWPLKPYAIAQSRFREVLFLDADTVPLIAPDAILDWDIYRRSGLLLWPDIIDLREGNPIWDTLDLEPRYCTSVDSSVVAIDKERAWGVLDLAILLNEHWEEVYQFLHGDKDTFLLASILAGGGHQIIEHRPFSPDFDLVQRDPEGNPLVHHRTSSKWKLFGPNPPVVEAELTQHCEEALAALRQRWSGVVFHPPERSVVARAQEATLIAVRWFHYELDSGEHRPIELLPAGVVGEGRAENEQHWAIVERDGGLVLQFFSQARLAVELVRRPDGSWQGRSIGNPGFEAKLVAECEWQTWPHANGAPIRRSATEQVAALLDPALFATGFDPQVRQELQAALALLNRLFDDVPEQLASQFAALRLPRAWEVALEELARDLTASRDAREALASRNVIAPVNINPAHYNRVY
jgi:alpha 1,2-mannosyltransferase